jgi:proline iminopeptidase
VKAYKSVTLLSVFVFAWGFISAKGLYIKTFGDKQQPAIIFLHGGPGYNSASFELSTAQRLSDSGYFVIIFDTRGNGRSVSANAAFTYNEEIRDIQSIYDSFHISKASLLGHSFGGSVIIKFAEIFPNKVSHLVLISAPLNYPHTFRSILAHCRTYYEKNQPASIQYIDLLDKMDSTKLEYATYCFMNAMACKLYNTKNPTNETKSLLKRMQSDTMVIYMTKSEYEPVKGFYMNENYTIMSLYGELGKLKSKVKIAGIYGDEDGLFDTGELDKIKNTVGPENFFLVSGASHSVFIDQQTIFLTSLQKILKN